MRYAGQCHCGGTRFSVEAEIESLISCNCSICRQRGYLLFFVAPERFALETPDDKLSTYTFNKHAIRHRFCPACGGAPFGEGEKPGGGRMVAVNARCLPDLDLDDVKITKFDGASL